MSAGATRYGSSAATRAFTAWLRASPDAPRITANSSSVSPSAPEASIDNATTVEAGEVTTVLPCKELRMPSPRALVCLTTLPASDASSTGTLTRSTPPSSSAVSGVLSTSTVDPSPASERLGKSAEQAATRATIRAVMDAVAACRIQAHEIAAVTRTPLFKSEPGKSPACTYSNVSKSQKGSSWEIMTPEVILNPAVYTHQGHRASGHRSQDTDLKRGSTQEGARRSGIGALGVLQNQVRRLRLLRR